MKLLLDQDVYAITAKFLRGLGHEVVTAAEADLSRVVDESLLAAARAHERILVTRDRDFGALVFSRRIGSGVIYLRILPSLVEPVHRELRRVLETYSESELRLAFVVVGPGRHRFRRLPEQDAGS